MLQCSRPTAFVYLLALTTAPITFALNPADDLNQYGRQTWQTENGLPQNSVQSILQTADGYVWLGTEGGLVRFDGVRFAVYDTQNTPALKSNNVLSLVESRDGALWLGTAEGVTRYRDSVFRTFGEQDGVPAGNVRAISCDRAGTVWAFTSSGPARFDKDHFRADSGGQITSAIAAVTNSHLGLLGSRINAWLQDKEGAIWAGSEFGLARLANGKVERFPANDPLSSDIVHALLEDKEGNVWIGTDSGGLTVLRSQKFTTHAFKEGGTDEQIRCVFEDRSGVVWVGTNGSGLKRYKDGAFSSFSTHDGLSSNVILALAEDSEGALLVGTPEGLNRIRKSGVSVITAADGLAEDFVRSIFTDRDGTLWIGTRRGLSHVHQGTVTTYTKANGLGSDLVGAMLRDPLDNLWIATFNGLTRLSGERFTNFQIGNGLSSNVITDLYLDSQGCLWIATRDGGLNRFLEGSFTKFGSHLGLPETIYGITEDLNHDLWLAAKTGIYRVSKAELNHFALSGTGNVAVVSYGTSDGLRVRECSGGGHPAVWKDHHGAIWFSTAKGAAVLTQNHSALNRVPPPVALESVSVDDRILNLSQLQEIAPGHSRFAFEYAGLSFVAPQKVQFKYKLEGFDRQWIDAGTRRVAYYTNLPPKVYRFRVIARNNDGFWSEKGGSFVLRIQPHFYQTWWFDIVLLLAAAMLIYAVYDWRVRQVRARFDAVLLERNRIAREIHDTLAQGFVGVSVQLEVVSRLLSSSIEAAREHLDQARVLVRSGLAEARQSIWELRSQASEQQDFASRLSQLARQASESSTTKIQLKVHGIYRPLTRNVENELFRIGQEAVTNAIRHADAKHITIDLTFDSRRLWMKVADDGRGFHGYVHSFGPDGHFGLKGMRERAEQINADLTISSIPGEGTTISVETRLGNGVN